MLDVLGENPKPDRIRRVLDVAVAVWNACTLERWEDDDRYVDGARARILGDYPELIDTFEHLVRRAREDFATEDWGIAAWDLSQDDSGQFRLSVEARLRS